MKPKRFDVFYIKKEVERFYLVQKLGNETITFLCVPEPLKSKSGRFYVCSLKTLKQIKNIWMCSKIFKTKAELFHLIKKFWKKTKTF